MLFGNNTGGIGARTMCPSQALQAYFALANSFTNKLAGTYSTFSVISSVILVSRDSQQGQVFSVSSRSNGIRILGRSFDNVSRFGLRRLCDFTVVGAWFEGNVHSMPLGKRMCRSLFFCPGSFLSTLNTVGFTVTDTKVVGSELLARLSRFSLVIQF